MHSATDHGYNVDWAIRVFRGMICVAKSGHGLYTYRVARPHRDAGYWETVITEGGHPALIGSVQIKRERDIIADASAE